MHALLSQHMRTTTFKMPASAFSREGSITPVTITGVQILCEDVQ